MSQPASDAILPEAIELGPVGLAVSNLDRAVRFYQSVLGMQLRERHDGQAELGTATRTLVELVEQPQAVRDEASAGLFHTAFLLPERSDLGRFLLHLAASGGRLTGMADHAVSEAVYLDDPDGNGIEVYADRPRAAWYQNGRFVLDNRALDVDGLMRTAQAEGRPWQGLPEGTVVGHVHLETQDLAASRRFYASTMGLAVMADWRHAVFLSKGGYHHHVAINDWQRRTRPLRPDRDALGLRHVTLALPAAAAPLSALAGKLPDAQAVGDRVEVRDPAGVTWHLVAA